MTSDLPQLSIPAVYMRGGTSRAIVFHERDLPPDANARDRLFLAALGSPDPGERQLDGLGGGISSLSKIAIVAPSSRPDADVDYTFAQVSVSGAHVSYRGNCGNISSAIGPFAVDEALVVAEGDHATVRIHNTNTRKIIHATFPLQGGKAAVRGDCAIAGVAGTGAAVRLDFHQPGGAVTGRLLPTGRTREQLSFGNETVEVSLVDASNPVVFVAASAFGLAPTQAPTDLARFEDLRVAASLRMGIAANEEEARTVSASLPLVAFVSAPAAGGDVAVRMLSSGQPHKATPLTGALCLAVAARIEGTIVADLARPVDPGRVRIEHPAGILTVAAQVSGAGADARAEFASFFRTARRLMEGRVLVPR
jgi:2-methylaconitate cis-trans-isomerase PrpF